MEWVLFVPLDIDEGHGAFTERPYVLPRVGGRSQNASTVAGMVRMG